jgi:hypothetical protein
LAQSSDIRLNCSDLNWKNETHPIDERLHCYLDETNIYGVNTNVLNKYIFTNHENIHAQRGFDCVKRGLETSKPGKKNHATYIIDKLSKIFHDLYTLSQCCRADFENQTFSGIYLRWEAEKAALDNKCI